MAYKVIILYRLYMPSYVLGTFTEYPYSILILIFYDFNYLARFIYKDFVFFSLTTNFYLIP